MSRIRLFPLIAGGVALAVLATGGCIFSPQSEDGGPATPPPEAVWPDTPEKLMGNFEIAYLTMDYTIYEDVLHEDYKFVFADGLRIWERLDDLESMQNLFAGNPGEDPDTGAIKPGVQSIDINTFIPLGDWIHEPATHPNFPDSERALYNVMLVFNLGLGDDGTPSTITVQSDQLFYVRSEEIDQGDGTTKTKFFLLGQQDFDDLPDL
jgi:hypothetical protein